MNEIKGKWGAYQKTPGDSIETGDDIGSFAVHGSVLTSGKVVSGNGNSYDYGARLYNPRIGRWMKRDQKEGKYPFSTPYSYAFNTPLFLKDYDGRDVNVTITSTDKALSLIHI